MKWPAPGETYRGTGQSHRILHVSSRAWHGGRGCMATNLIAVSSDFPKYRITAMGRQIIAFRIRCSHCRSTVTTDETLAGRLVDCPGCKKPSLIRRADEIAMARRIMRRQVVNRFLLLAALSPFLMYGFLMAFVSASDVWRYCGGSKTDRARVEVRTMGMHARHFDRRTVAFRRALMG
jgi:hypothetical protein